MVFDRITAYKNGKRLYSKALQISSGMVALKWAVPVKFVCLATLRFCAVFSSAYLYAFWIKKWFNTESGGSKIIYKSL